MLPMPDPMDSDERQLSDRTLRLERWLGAGRLAAALGEARVAVNESPGDPKLRFLFLEILLLSGDVEEAGHQAEELRRSDETFTERHPLLCELLRGEAARRALYLHGQPPPIALAPPEPFVGPFIEAAMALSVQRADVAGALIAGAQPPSCSGRIAFQDGSEQEFDDIEDAGSIPGPALPLVLPGNYAWLPWTQLRRLELDPCPGEALYSVLRPASLSWNDGAEIRHGRAWIPMRYPSIDRTTLAEELRPGVMLEDHGAGLSIAHGWRAIKLRQGDAQRIADLGKVRWIQIGEPQ